MRLALFVLCSALVVMVVSGDAIHHHSLEPPYITQGWETGIPFWELAGDTVVTNQYVRLTPDQSSRVGWVYNTQPADIPSWQFIATFRIHNAKSPGADGIALWYVSQPAVHLSSQGPLFGMAANFTGLGIILDTYDNDQKRDNPAVIAIIGKGEAGKTWDTSNDLAHDLRIKCVMDFRSLPSQKANNAVVRVVYHQRRLEVYVQTYPRIQQETLCGTLEEVDLPQGYHFAASASTGHLVDTHDIYSFAVTAASGTTADHDPQIPLADFDPKKESEEKQYWIPKNPSDAAEAGK